MKKQVARICHFFPVPGQQEEIRPLTLEYLTLFVPAGVLSALCYTFMSQNYCTDDTYTPRCNL